VLPSCYPNIDFDDHDICNFCRKDITNATINWESHRKELDKLIDEAVARHLPYDILVPWSGGKDSSYVLYFLRKHYKCKILAVNFHNGFQSEAARQNLASVSEHLCFDLITLKPDWSLLRKIYALFMQKKGELCTVCNTVGYAVFLSFAARQAAAFGDYPLMIGGWSKTLEGMEGADHFNYQTFSNILKNEDGLLDSFESSPLVDRAICDFLHGIDDPRSTLANASAFSKRFIQLPDYIDWNPDVFQSLLEKEAGYTTSKNGMKSHFDCIITPVARHFYMEEWGFDQSVTALSTMIRKNMISREEAISRLNVDSSVDAKLMKFFLDKIGLKSDEINIRKHL
jgi:hypothetical protein